VGLLHSINEGLVGLIEKGSLGGKFTVGFKRKTQRHFIEKGSRAHSICNNDKQILVRVMFLLP
jgi:hypothetical protein